LPLDKQFSVGHHIVVSLLQKFNHLRVIAVLLLQLIKNRIDGQLTKFLIELAKVGPAFLLPTGYLAHDCFQLLFQLFYYFQGFIAYFLRQGVEFLWFENLAVPGGGQRVSIGRLDHGNIKITSFFRQLLKCLLFLVLVAFPEVLDTCLVFIALEGGRKNAEQLFHRVDHVVAQRNRHTHWKPERDGSIRVFEIVDITPVVQLTPRRSLLVENAVQQFPFANPGAAQHKQVVAFVRDIESEQQSLQRSILAEMVLQRFQFIAVFEAQCFGVALPVKLFR